MRHGNSTWSTVVLATAVIVVIPRGSSTNTDTVAITIERIFVDKDGRFITIRVIRILGVLIEELVTSTNWRLVELGLGAGLSWWLGISWGVVVRYDVFSQ